MKISYADRCELTSRYNVELEKLCRKIDIYYMDMVPDLTVSMTGQVKPELLNKNENDHHLEISLAAPLYANKIGEILNDKAKSVL